MKVTAPQMGTLQILLEDLFGRLGTEFIPAPATNQEALEIGSRLGPELACLPLKIAIGNLVQGLEKGADTIVMAGGVGPCRFGYYAQIQRLILERAGYKFKTIVVEPPGAGFREFVGAFEKLAPGVNNWQLYNIIKTSFYKTRALDFLEKKSLHLRAYETKKGSITKAKKKGMELISTANSKREIKNAYDKAADDLENVKSDNKRDVLRVGLTGEFYLLLEPFANFDIEEYLGHRGIYIERGVYISDWISPSGKNKVFGVPKNKGAQDAAPYLDHFVGGEGQPTISHVVHFAEEEFDGAIHLFPFTCMPEIIADNILPKVLKDHDFSLLTLVLDEQSGRAGLITRLEAFIDLMKSRRKQLMNKGETECNAA